MKKRKIPPQIVVPLHSCFTKVKYHSLETAEYKALEMTLKYSEQIQAYACRQCQKFHVGHVATGVNKYKKLPYSRLRKILTVYQSRSKKGRAEIEQVNAWMNEGGR